MNFEEKQELKDGSWVFPLLCLGLLMGLTVLPLGRSSPEEKVVRARAKAEVLAYQVAQLYKESLAGSEDFSTEGRGPASVGSSLQASATMPPAEGLMGQDPWGQPYRYKIESLEDGKLSVQMRSKGPGQKAADSLEEDIVVHFSF